MSLPLCSLFTNTMKSQEAASQTNAYKKLFIRLFASKSSTLSIESDIYDNCFLMLTNQNRI